MKTAVRAGLVAILATLLAAPAQAATIRQVTGTCHNGDFAGRFTLRYEVSDGYLRPIGVISSAGPYIGDSGTRVLRISYHDGLSTHMIYSHVSPATNGEHSETLPGGLAIPATAHAAASTKFDNGTTSCTAAVVIR